MLVCLKKNESSGKANISSGIYLREWDEMNMISQADQIPSELVLAIVNNDLYNTPIKLQLK